MQRKFAFVPGEYYHVYNRGIEKRVVFKEAGDWVRFQHLLHLCNSKNPLVFKTIQGSPLDVDMGGRLVSLLAYSLMPNHFHIVIQENSRGGLSRFLGRLLTAYSMYFNIKYDRSGALFCRPTKARHIVGDEYFRWVFSYIHLNPLEIYRPGWKEGGIKDRTLATEFIKKFSYSSYPDYFVGERKEGIILDKESLPIKLAGFEKIDDMLLEIKAFQGGPLDNQ